MANKSMDQTAVGTGVEDSQWRRVHPVTPFARTWAVLLAIIAFFTYQNVQLLQELADTGVVEFLGLKKIFLAVFAFIIFIFLVVGFFSWLSWKRMSFAVTDEAVYYREGILNRRQRHSRLSRIQAVNISHPLIGRIFGLGNIDIEVAGGADSNFRFGLLKTAELEDLRREIMTKSAGVKRAAATSMSEGGAANATDDAGTPVDSGQGSPDATGKTVAGRASAQGFDDRERLIFKVPTPRLLASIFTNMGAMLAIFIGLLMGGSSMFAMVQFGAARGNILPAMIGVLAVFSWVWSHFASNFHFAAYVTPDGIRVSSGLTSTRSQTIAPRRIHGVTVNQPFLWRFFGWYKVVIIQAGFVASEDQRVDHSVLLPVGTRDEMLQALWMVYPDLGVSRPIDVIDFGIDGEGPGMGFTKNPERSKLFDPFVWKRRAIALTDVAILIRDGFLTRMFTVLPYGRLQSTQMFQGPWDRKRGLVSIAFNMVQPGSNNSILHLDEAEGVAIYHEVTRQALLRRMQESPDEWARRTLPATNSGPKELFQERVPEDGPMTVSEDSVVQQSAVASDLRADSPAGAPESHAQGPVQESGEDQ